jgi:hypothetical protein
MPTIKALGYVGCRVSDLSAWDRFLGAVFGLTNHFETGAGTHRYEVGGWLDFEQSSNDSLSYIGWEVCSHDALHGMAATLQERGLQLSWGDEALRARRGVSELLLFSGPDGVPTELFAGPVKRNAPRPPSGLQLGHVVLASEDRRAGVVETWGTSCSRRVPLTRSDARMTR